MAYTYDELKHKTLAQLRDIAANTEHEAVQGYTQLNKEHLLVATAIRTKIKELKEKRGQAIEASDRKKLKEIRRRIHRLKRTIHKATV
jgi:hypothetical protein